ncbi:PQQ-like beta-propeller repeat protein [Actinoallomurus soli]|uniref:PQQ-like beta-propeller repeat protein n=1 Tax=Actinoallomurus soli TaxID=2952535 RepID=UPI0020932513|nr:PQQ-like beta-propeller repeat protein [Actinoallomurus soli]MCO5971894.1 PQQ-like beta-propeller repeat protein [Actinoallomurus soli]
MRDACAGRDQGADRPGVRRGRRVVTEGEFGDVLSGLNPATGARRWRWTAPDKPVIGAVAQGRNTLYAATDTRLYALKDTTRKRLWSAEAPFTLFNVVDTAVAGWADDGAGSSNLMCLDRATGHRRWIRGSGAGDITWISVSDTTVTFREGAETTTPNVCAIDMVTGKQRWQYASGRLLGQPLATNDAVYVGGQEGTPFYALDARTGQVRWKTAFGQSDAAPVADHSAVYVIDAGGNTLHALDVTDGHERWRFDGGTFQGVCGRFDGVVYLTGYYGMTYALHAETGRLLWSYHATKPQQVITTGDGTLILTCSTAIGKNTLYGLRAT